MTTMLIADSVDVSGFLRSKVTTLTPRRNRLHRIRTGSKQVTSIPVPTLTPSNVVYQDRLVTGEHIVRVGVVDGEVLHPFQAGPDLDRGHGLAGLAVGAAQLVA